MASELTARRFAAPRSGLPVEDDAPAVDAPAAGEHPADRRPDRSRAPPSRIRADSVSAVSSSCTGTARCMTIGPGVELGRHEVHRRAADLDAVLERLPLRVDARKRRQQRRMNVQDRAAETPRRTPDRAGA